MMPDRNGVGYSSYYTQSKRNFMPLQDEVLRLSKEIITDGYAMSIGELMSLYKEDEIDLHPEFQRNYRWTDLQKSQLIESILIGIPLPSIFVFQREDNVWEVIDGLQRLSTIFEFIGCLKDKDGHVIAPSKLLGTRYLPSLENKLWESEDTANSLTHAQRIQIKRTKIDIKIIKPGSSETSKYELFYRLNRYGTSASDQEVRNCLLIMSNAKVFPWLQSLSKYKSFIECSALTERLQEEQYDIELILRFFLLKDMGVDQFTFSDLDEFITDRMLKRAEKWDQALRDKDEEIFKKTFDIIHESNIAEDAFRRYDKDKNKFFGGFSISAFEVVAMGIGYHITKDVDWKPSIEILEIVKKIWKEKEFTSSIGSGIRVSSRLPKTISIGRSILTKAEQ